MSEFVNLVEVSPSPDLIVGIVHYPQLDNRWWINRLAVYDVVVSRVIQVRQNSGAYPSLCRVPQSWLVGAVVASPTRGSL